jgi:hypothetical protein
VTSGSKEAPTRLLSHPPIGIPLTATRHHIEEFIRPHPPLSLATSPRMGEVMTGLLALASGSRIEGRRERAFLSQAACRAPASFTHSSGNAKAT